MYLASKAKAFFTHTAVTSLPNHQVIEHVDVEQLARAWHRPRVENLFANKNPSMRRQLFANVTEDRAAVFITPVMQNELHDVRVTAGRNLLEEAACFE